MGGSLFPFRDHDDCRSTCIPSHEKHEQPRYHSIAGQLYWNRVAHGCRCVSIPRNSEEITTMSFIRAASRSPIKPFPPMWNRHHYGKAFDNLQATAYTYTSGEDKSLLKGADMSEFLYKTNGEELKCVNCKNGDFNKLASVSGLSPFECQRCHFVSWFPDNMAPAEKPQ